MDDNIAPIMTGLAVGIIFVIVFSFAVASLPSKVSTVVDDVTFFGLYPNLTINQDKDDIDGCCGEIATFALVTIPENASNSQSGKSFVPQTVTVVIGVNNTVRWINQDTSIYFIEADNDMYDPAFYQLTEMTASAQANRSNTDSSKDNVLYPQEYFEYTFTKPGEYGYHSKPWMRGIVIVLEK